MKKSVRLLTIAALGFASCPVSVFGEEVVPTVSQEPSEVQVQLIEQPIENQLEEGKEVNEAVLPESADDTSTQSSELQEETVEQVLKNDSETPEKSESLSEPNEVPVVESTSKNDVELTQSPMKSTLAVADYDGKLTDHDKSIVDEEATITADYNFMPNFDNLDDIVISGGTYSKIEGKTDRFLFDLKTASKDSITVTYKNVGTYNGKKIDMMIKVKDWTFLGNNPLRDLFIYSNNSISLNGLKDVLLDYTFLDNLTLEAIKVSGFFNFTDIDLKQSLDIYGNNIKNFYVGKDNQLYYKEGNGYISIGDKNGVAAMTEDERYWITYTYDQMSNFSIRFKQEDETRAFFSYSYQAPVVIEEEPKDDLLIEVPKTTESESVNKVIDVPIFESLAVTSPIEAQSNDKKVAVTQSQSQLPETGEYSNPLYYLVGSLLMGVALILKKKSNKKIIE